VTGWGAGVEPACDVGDAFGAGDPARGEGEWPAALFGPPPHAAAVVRASNTAAARQGLPGAATRGCVPISKGNDCARAELRFPVPSTL